MNALQNQETQTLLDEAMQYAAKYSLILIVAAGIVASLASLV